MSKSPVENLQQQFVLVNYGILSVMLLICRVAVYHSQLRTIASDTVDPNDYLLLTPALYRAVPPWATSMVRMWSQFTNVVNGTQTPDLRNIRPLHYILLLILKKVDKAGRELFTPFRTDTSLPNTLDNIDVTENEDPSPTIPTYRRKEEKRKTVADKKGTSRLGQ